MDKKSFYYLLIVFVVFVLAVTGIYSTYIMVSSDISFSGVFFFMNFNSGVSLSLQTEQQQYKVGDTVPVEIVIDTKGKKVDGVDIIIVYPTGQLSMSSNKSLDTSGGVFDDVLGPKIDLVNQQIEFSAIKIAGRDFQGQGRIATLNLLAIQAGEVEISYVFEKNDTTDTNVSGVSEEGDLLTKTNNLKITVYE